MIRSLRVGRWVGLDGKGALVFAMDVISWVQP